jgi:hypothetical protein
MGLQPLLVKTDLGSVGAVIWVMIATTTGSEWGIAERLVFASAPAIGCNKAICPSVDERSVARFQQRFFTSRPETQPTKECLWTALLDYAGSRRKGLGVSDMRKYAG